jgi:phage terminase large subunit-like protein
MREFSQSNLRKMVEACQATYQTVLRRGMRHGGEAKLTQHVNQAVAVQVATGSAAWVLRKGKAKRKMDGAVALVMAVWGLLHPEPEPESKLVDLHMEFV